MLDQCKKDNDAAEEGNKFLETKTNRYKKELCLSEHKNSGLRKEIKDLEKTLRRVHRERDGLMVESGGNGKETEDMRARGQQRTSDMAGL